MKKMHKTLLATIGIVVCLLGMLPAASAQEPTIIIANASADPGLTTTAEIRCHDVEHLLGFTITLGYDPDIVMVVDEETNPEFGIDLSVIANNKTGEVILGPLSITADVTGADVWLATVTLRADGNSSEQSVLDITTNALINTDNEQIRPRTDIDGVFTVTGEVTDPILAINLASHDFGNVPPNETRTFTFEITNSGAGTLDWNITSDQAWIAVSPVSGSNAGTVTVTADMAGLSDGAHSGTVTVSSNGGTETVAVNVNVQPATAEPQTPFIIDGYVNDSNGALCNDPWVLVTNTNTGVSWDANNSTTSNYYRLVIGSDDVSANDVLKIETSVCSQSNTTAHTIAEIDIGGFELNITLEGHPVITSCNDTGVAQDGFYPGDSVWVNGTGLAPNTDYTIWIQPDPVDEGDELNASIDPSGSQETVTTGADGSFGPDEIWNNILAGSQMDYDIVVDKQDDGANTGKYNEASDGIDSANGVVGIVAPIPELATIALFAVGLVMLLGYMRLGRRE